MNARIYDPEAGRFESADDLIPDLFDSQSLNRFTYVDNRPLSLTDPTGHIAHPFEGFDCSGSRLGGSCYSGGSAGITYCFSPGGICNDYFARIGGFGKSYWELSPADREKIFEILLSNGSVGGSDNATNTTTTKAAAGVSGSASGKISPVSTSSIEGDSNGKNTGSGDYASGCSGGLANPQCGINFFSRTDPKTGESRLVPRSELTKKEEAFAQRLERNMLRDYVIALLYGDKPIIFTIHNAAGQQVVIHTSGNQVAKIMENSTVKLELTLKGPFRGPIALGSTQSPESPITFYMQSLAGASNWVIRAVYIHEAFHQLHDVRWAMWTKHGFADWPDEHREWFLAGIEQLIGPDPNPGPQDIIVTGHRSGG
jgi:hypothetical protein